MNVSGPLDVKISHHFCLQKKHKGIISCRRYQIQREKKDSPVIAHIRSLARCSVKIREKEKRLLKECMTAILQCHGQNRNTTRDVGKKADEITKKGERVQKSFALIVEVVIVGRMHLSP